MTDKKSTQLVSATQKKLIIEKTPTRWIKQRRGPSGLVLDYVETGYVIEMLNKIFNYNWTFEITEEKVGNKQVYVKGRLTGRFPNPTTNEFVEITKEQYGGNDIKFLRNTTDPVSIADDLKAASSDALKKCASLFGIAGDVYWKSGAEFYAEQEKQEADTREITEAQQKKVFAILDEKNKTKQDLDDYIDRAFNKMSIQQLTMGEADRLIQKLESLPGKQSDIPQTEFNEEEAKESTEGITY